MIKVTESGSTVITGEHIGLYRLMALKHGLAAEAKGLKITRGVSLMTLAKRHYGLKGNREKIIAQVQAMIDQFKPANEEKEE